MLHLHPQHRNSILAAHLMFQTDTTCSMELMRNRIKTQLWTWENWMIQTARMASGIQENTWTMRCWAKQNREQDIPKGKGDDQTLIYDKLGQPIFTSITSSTREIAVNAYWWLWYLKWADIMDGSNKRLRNLGENPLKLHVQWVVWPGERELSTQSGSWNVSRCIKYWVDIRTVRKKPTHVQRLIVWKWCKTVKWQSQRQSWSQCTVLMILWERNCETLHVK